MTIETTMARLRGAREAGLGVIVVDCPYREGSPQARAWVDGYLLAVADLVSVKPCRSAAGSASNVKRNGARWRWAEQRSLERGWRTLLATMELAHRLSRSTRSVRVSAHRLGLGIRPRSRRSKREGGVETSAP